MQEIERDAGEDMGFAMVIMEETKGDEGKQR